MRIVVAVDEAVGSAVERANRRIADAAEGRTTPAAVEAALERAREAIESLSQVSAELQAGLPDAIQDGLKEHFRPSAQHLAEVRGLMNQVLRRLERVEGDLLAERHARVDDLALLVDLVASRSERAREAIESLSQVSAELQAGLPDAIQDGLKEHFRPSAQHLAEVRGLMNQVLRRLERVEGDLLAERHARVDDLALLVDLVAS